ncbi:heme ABC transporter ATP-binding protein [Vandammella animalimorsus]|uniref:heme ABC transporter ATP-binding protein n=1 Tax=Vandammella animalimorsus TaxID=2029117 RepID=UPI0031B9C7E2
MELSAQRLSWQAAARHIVREVSLRVHSGEMVGLLGPNGSGKSTLLRMIYRTLPPSSGQVLLDGSDLWQQTPRRAAQAMAVLAQQGSPPFALSVHEVVLMGRIPHQRPLARDSAQDLQIVAQALARVGAQALAHRRFDTLSGGEQQRVLLARALAQQPRLLVLDEPTNHLDVRHQFELMNLLRSLRLSTLAALHDLQLAAHYCDRIYLLQGGAIAAQGRPAEVLDAATIARVYGVPAQVRPNPRTGKPLIEFLPDDLPGALSGALPGAPSDEPTEPPAHAPD